MIAKDGVSRARVADGADGADGMAAHTRRLMGWGNDGKFEHDVKLCQILDHPNSVGTNS